ncbi:ATP-binding cassette domain-containing protein [Mycoplasma sp. Sp33II]|uniref:ATP-binding cassette domain-containing protein n=1 Tax=unclassified Mycoplasma TaxID=2683645 RepID=UPI003AAA4173
MLEFKDVALSYENKEVLSNLNFSFQPGEIVGLIGRSGEGKSTILKSIFDLSIVLKGQIIYQNQIVNQLKRKELKNYKAQISFIDADTLSLLNYDAYKNILFNFNNYTNTLNALLHHLTAAQLNNLWELFTKFELQDYALTPLSMLSSGQRQRFNFIAGIFNHSEILLCDEVTSNLDMNNSHKIFNYLNQIKDQKIIITAIHDIELAMQYCDRLIAVKGGKIVNIIQKQDYNKEMLALYFDE